MACVCKSLSGSRNRKQVGAQVGPHQGRDRSPEAGPPCPSFGSGRVSGGRPAGSDLRRMAWLRPPPTSWAALAHVQELEVFRRAREFFHAWEMCPECPDEHLPKGATRRQLRRLVPPRANLSRRAGGPRRGATGRSGTHDDPEGWTPTQLAAAQDVVTREQGGEDAPATLAWNWEETQHNITPKLQVGYCHICATTLCIW